jgi:hypothetical protein
MIRYLSCTLAVALVLATVSFGQNVVEVAGGSTKYPVGLEATLGDKKIPMKLTGVAMRKKAIFNVYTIGSYIQSDSTVKTAEELASADVVKQLHLVMERNVTGQEMANAFHDAIRANYPTEFKDELEKLLDLMRTQNADKGDNVWITSIPGFGVHVNLVGKKSEMIQNAKFAKAIWEIYLGPKNIGEPVKKGLISRLDK